MLILSIGWIVVQKLGGNFTVYFESRPIFFSEILIILRPWLLHTKNLSILQSNWLFLHWFLSFLEWIDHPFGIRRFYLLASWFNLVQVFVINDIDCGARLLFCCRNYFVCYTFVIIIWFFFIFTLGTSLYFLKLTRSILIRAWSWSSDQAQFFICFRQSDPLWLLSTLIETRLSSSHL